MGSLLSYLWWGGDPDVINSSSGLTRRKIYAVQRTWALIYADVITHGTELLKRYFAEYPDSKEFFKMVKKLREEEYIGNAQFKAHVINLMSAINLALTNLHQPEVVAAMMNKLGESHKRRKINEKYFLDLKQTIVKMFSEVLKLDNFTIDAWGKTIDFLFKHIFQTLNAS